MQFWNVPSAASEFVSILFLGYFGARRNNRKKEEHQSAFKFDGLDIDSCM